MTTRLHENGDVVMDALANLTGLARNAMPLDALGGYYMNT